MKKILTFALSLVLALSLLCCGAMAEAADVTGEWYGDVFGMTMILTLTDGTYTMDLAGEVDGGTYSFDGTTLYMDEGTDVIDVALHGDGTVCDPGRGLLFCHSSGAASEDHDDRHEGSQETLHV